MAHDRSLSGHSTDQGDMPAWIAREFALAPELIYLNHAAVAPWPRRTCEAVQHFAAENMRQGAVGYASWSEQERTLRHSLAWLLNAPSADDIALLKNTSEALSTVAYGLDWRRGDNIVSFAQEFPSNRIVWESLASRGVALRLVDLRAATDPEELLISRCDRRTRLAACSAVQYADGRRMDLDRLGAFCRDRNILFCVDAIQSLGALPFDVQACRADFAMADGHKWMLGPEGLAVFYCRAELRERLKLHQYGWHMVAHAGEFDRTDWQPAQTAQRFECGSPNMLGIHGLQASLELLQEVGSEQISRRVLKNTSLLIDYIDKNNFRLITPREQSRRSGIVTFVPGRADPAAVHRYLLGRGVICARRGGGIRFSPHFYTASAKLSQAFEILSDFKG